MRSLVRMLMLSLAVACLAVGVVGLGIAYAPAALAESLSDAALAGLETGLPMLPIVLPSDAPGHVIDTLADRSITRMGER